MQESAGVILSMARFRIWKPKEIFFNISLFIWHLGFLIWTYIFDTTRRVLIGIITVEIVILSIFYGWEWFWLFLWLAAWIIYALIPGRVPLWLIIMAALVMHVRLCLERIKGTNRWRYISQSAPDAELDEWDDSQLLGNHFIYMAPGFKPAARFIEAMIEYARKHVNDRGKRGYDYLQLISILLNSILFWWIPALHGKEVIKFMNIPGFKEVCSTLVAAILRWAKLSEIIEAEGLLKEYVIHYYRDHQTHLRGFFEGYVTSMVCPGLYPIEAYLHGTWILPERWQRKMNGKLINAEAA